MFIPSSHSPFSAPFFEDDFILLELLVPWTLVSV